ncbi:TPA: MFS transporter, partial [Streptococcus agalactiae]
FPEVSFKNVNEFISTASNVVVPEKIHGQLEQIVLGALHNVFFLALLLCVITFVVNLFDDGKLRA